MMDGVSALDETCWPQEDWAIETELGHTSLGYPAWVEAQQQAS